MGLGHDSVYLFGRPKDVKQCSKPEILCFTMEGAIWDGEGHMPSGYVPRWVDSSCVCFRPLGSGPFVRSFVRSSVGPSVRPSSRSAVRPSVCPSVRPSVLGWGRSSVPSRLRLVRLFVGPPVRPSVRRSVARWPARVRPVVRSSCRPVVLPVVSPFVRPSATLLDCLGLVDGDPPTRRVLGTTSVCRVDACHDPKWNLTGPGGMG